MDDHNFTPEPVGRANAAMGIGTRRAGGFPFNKATPGYFPEFDEAKHVRGTFAGPDSVIGATPAPLMTTIINRERQQVHALMALHEEVCSVLFALAGATAIGDYAPTSTAETAYKGGPPEIGQIGELAALGSEQDKIIQTIRQVMVAFQAYI